METIRIADFEIGAGPLTILGGPCAAESPDICLQVASEMKRICAKLGLNYIFKASFDKANRSSVASYRGPGLQKGLEILAEVKKQFGLPVVTDIHESCQAKPVSEVADLIQIPAFLARQTDLLLAAVAAGRPVNVKKGQFMAPEDMKCVVEKVHSGKGKVMLTERGSSFGYHNLVVDFRGLQTMREMGVPVCFDVTHSVQLPGGLGSSSGGQRQFHGALARAAAAVGIDALFMEVHPDPEHALSDGPNSICLADAEQFLSMVKVFHDASR